MTTQIVCSYVAFSGIVSPSTMAALMASVAVVPTVPDQYGLRLTNDVMTTLSDRAIRTLTYSMVPTGTATGTAKLGAIATQLDGVVTAVTLGSAGSGYVAAPVVTLSGGTPSAPASVVAVCKVTGSQLVIAGGTSYSATPTVGFVGGQLAPGGTVPVASATVAGGVITAVTVTTAGGPYQVAPQIVITDPSGSGAIVVASMSVDHFSVQTGGTGYKSIPTVVVTPLYKSIVPAGAPLTTEQEILASFMTQAFGRTMKTNVIATTPTVS